MLRFTDELIAAMARTSAVFVSLTLILSALAGIGSSSAGAQSASAAAVAPDQIVIEGKGFGHGRGLGQYGALGSAVEDGWTYEQILDGMPVAPSRVRAGDLVFPHTGHVQMAIGGGLVVEAPHAGATVQISRLGPAVAIRRPV